MKKTTVFLLSFFLIAAFTSAQEKTTKTPCLRVSSFSSSLGFSGALTSNTTSDYYTLKNAAENPDLFIDITGFSETGPGWGYNGVYFNGMSGFAYSGGGSGNGNLMFNLGLTPYSKKLGKYRENREIRLSIGGSLGTRNNFYYYDNNTFVIDTLQSINDDNTVYADSSIQKHYNYALDFSEINFGFSYIFKTDVNRTVHFYTGAGFNFGITLMSDVSVYEDVYRNVYYYNENDKPSEDDVWYYNTTNSNGYTYFSSKTNLKNPMMFARIYIPLGLEVRLCKKSTSFFSHVDLYTELNPGVEFQILSGAKTYANPYIGMAFIGFRYHW
jgi:hypothetical protein